MKIALERHQYAPEMTRAWIYDNRGRLAAIIPAPGCSTIKQARQLHFARPVEAARRVTIRCTRPAPWAGFDRDYSGLVPLGRAGLSIIQEMRRQLEKRHAGGALNDGRVLPDATQSIEFGPAVYLAPGETGGADYLARKRASDRRNWISGAAALARAA